MKQHNQEIIKKCVRELFTDGEIANQLNGKYDSTIGRRLENYKDRFSIYMFGIGKPKIDTQGNEELEIEIQQIIGSSIYKIGKKFEVEIYMQDGNHLIIDPLPFDWFEVETNDIEDKSAFSFYFSQKGIKFIKYFQERMDENENQKVFVPPMPQNEPKKLAQEMLKKHEWTTFLAKVSDKVFIEENKPIEQQQYFSVIILYAGGLYFEKGRTTTREDAEIIANFLKEKLKTVTEKNKIDVNEMVFIVGVNGKMKTFTKPSLEAIIQGFSLVLPHEAAKYVKHVDTTKIINPFGRN